MRLPQRSVVVLKESSDTYVISGPIVTHVATERQRSRRSGLTTLQDLRALGRVGELLGVDRVRAVEPGEGVRLAAGSLERVGVRVAQPHHPGRAALRGEGG